MHQSQQKVFVDTNGASSIIQAVPSGSFFSDWATLKGLRRDFSFYSLSLTAQLLSPKFTGVMLLCPTSTYPRSSARKCS
jgi:hypothetical protein